MRSAECGARSEGIVLVLVLGQGAGGNAERGMRNEGIVLILGFPEKEIPGCELDRMDCWCNLLLS